MKCLGGIQTANMPRPTELEIQTSPQRIAAILGTTLNENKMQGILTSLGFKVERLKESEKSSGNISHRIRIPSWRSTKDIACEVDIVEEVGRIIGYNSLVPVSPLHEIKAVRLSPGKTLFRKIQDFLVLHASALEVMTYPLVGLPLLEKSAWAQHNEKLVLANSLTPEHDRMRPSLIPSLLQTASENFKSHESFRFFECGRSYMPLADERFSQDLHQIGIVFHAAKSKSIISLIDTVEALITYLGFEFTLEQADADNEHSLIPAAWPGSHPDEFLDLQIRERSCGAVLSLHPQIAHQFRLKGGTSIAIMDFTHVIHVPVKNRIAYRPLDKFPGANFDVTVILPPRRRSIEVLQQVKKLRIKEIQSVGVLDVFELDGGAKALTIRVQFRDPDKTLDGEFLRNSEAMIMAALEKSDFRLR